MNKEGFERLQRAIPDGRVVTWEVAVGDDDEVFEGDREVRYVTGRLADAVTPAALLNELGRARLLQGTGEDPRQGPQLKVLGELSTAEMITFEDTRYVKPDRGAGVL